MNANISPDLEHLAVPISDLCEDGKNARRHNDRSLDAVAQSLSAFGQQRPVVARKRDKVVIAGNATLAGAKRLGWDRIAVTWFDGSGKDGEDEAFAIADNRSAELAQWDWSNLSDALDQAEAGGPDLSAALGFTVKEREKVRAFADPENSVEFPEFGEDTGDGMELHCKWVVKLPREDLEKLTEALEKAKESVPGLTYVVQT